MLSLHLGTAMFYLSLVHKSTLTEAPVLRHGYPSSTVWAEGGQTVEANCSISETTAFQNSGILWRLEKKNSTSIWSGDFLGQSGSSQPSTIVITTKPAQTTCPQFYAATTLGSCLKASLRSLSYDQASADCKSSGTHLAVIRDQATQDLITGSKAHWIGLRYNTSISEFVWSNGTPHKTGDFSLLNKNKIHNAHIFSCVITTSIWVLKRCTERNKYFCMTREDVVPRPNRVGQMQTSKITIKVTDRSFDGAVLKCILSEKNNHQTILSQSANSLTLRYSDHPRTTTTTTTTSTPTSTEESTSPSPGREKDISTTLFPVSCELGTYGAFCLNNCSPNCDGELQACDNRTGFCIFGCADGYQGDRCDTACDSGTYGANCSHSCSPTCRGPEKACDNVNGSCISGCEDGYEGEMCGNNVVGPVDKGNERKKDSDAKEDQGEGRQYNPGTAKAVISQWLFLVVFFFGFAGCIGICAAMLKKKKRTKKPQPDIAPSQTKTAGEDFGCVPEDYYYDDLGGEYFQEESEHEVFDDEVYDSSYSTENL